MNGIISDGVARAEWDGLPANARRARAVGLEEPFPGAKNVSPWLDEQATLRKEKNFFETRVIEYQTGAQLEW